MHVRYCTQSYWTCREKEKSFAPQYNVCRHRSMVGSMANPPPPPPDCIPKEDNCSYGDSEGADHSYLPPEVFSLTWHADVGHIMHMAPCIAYIIHRLLLPATLSFNLEFWIAHGSHIEPATNSICLLSSSSGVFYVVHVGWATNNRWSIVYLFKLKL